MTRTRIARGLALAAAVLACTGVSPALYRDLHWRFIGPLRGGRTTSITGVAGHPNLFYIGVVNGGVWKSDDAGRTWQPIFDSQPTGSIGALAVAPSDPNVVYAGSGEGLQRPDLAIGDGIYKSTDAGATWTHLGLRNGQQIPAIAVDPKNPDRLFVAVLGHPFGPNDERGVYRSLDGGATFARVLFKNENVGAYDVVLDPHDPNVVYATLWAARQAPWEIGGSFEIPGSGIYKSTDGGTTWSQLTDGLPQRLGRAEIAAAPSDPQIVYAIRRHARKRRRRLSQRRRRRALRKNERRCRHRPARRRSRLDCGRPARRERPLSHEHVDLPFERRRQDVRRDQGRAGRRRLPHGVDRSRQLERHRAGGRSRCDDLGQSRPHVEYVVQPADGADVSRFGGRPVSVLGLRRAAGERICLREQPRRLGSDHAARLAHGRRAGVRLRHSRSAPSGRLLRRKDRAVRRAHRTNARSLADRVAVETLSRHPHRAARLRSLRPQPPLLRLQRRVRNRRRRNAVARHQPRSHARSSGGAAGARTVRKRRSAARHASRRRLRNRAVVPAARHDLGRHRRRIGVDHARRRRPLAQRHAAGNDAVEQGGADRRVARRRRHGLRCGQSLPLRRPSPVRLRDARRRERIGNFP